LELSPVKLMKNGQAHTLELKILRYRVTVTLLIFNFLRPKYTNKKRPLCNNYNPRNKLFQKYTLC